MGRRATANLTVRSRPEKLLVIYDGDCGFCRDAVRWIRRHAPENLFAYLKAAEPRTRALFPLDEKQLLRALHVVDTEGRVFVADEAVREVLKRLPRFRSLTWLWRLPLAPVLLRRGYDFVAARRRRSVPLLCRRGGPPAG